MNDLCMRELLRAQIEFWQIFETAHLVPPEGVCAPKPAADSSNSCASGGEANDASIMLSSPLVRPSMSAIAANFANYGKVSASVKNLLEQFCAHVAPCR